MGSEISSLCSLNRKSPFHIKKKPVLKTSKFRRQMWLAATRKKRERPLLAEKMFKRYPCNTTKIITNPNHKITLTFCLQNQVLFFRFSACPIMRKIFFRSSLCFCNRFTFFFSCSARNTFLLSCNFSFRLRCFSLLAV